MEEVTIGLQLAQSSQSLFAPASQEWLTYQENLLASGITQSGYSVAEAIAQQTESNFCFRATSSLFQERWPLYHAYLQWMQSVTRPMPHLDVCLLRQLTTFFQRG